MKPPLNLTPEPDKRPVEQRYLDLLASVMAQKMRPEWKPEAGEIARLLMSEGLLASTPKLEDKHQFLMEAISENPLVWENSNLENLMAAKYRPEHATSATEIASLLLLPVSE